MDWVDFKMHVIKYRVNYVNLYCFTAVILLKCIRSYSAWRESGINGEDEHKTILKYGFFLYYFAELQNLTVGYITEKEKDEYYIDWSMIKNGISIVEDFQRGQCNDKRTMVRVAQWCRKWYPYVMTQRHFKDGLIAYIRYRNDVLT